jgi:hypothetical protein
MFEDSEQMGSESTAVQTTRYVSIADGERAGGGGGRGKEGIAWKQSYPEGSDYKSTVVETTTVARRVRKRQGRGKMTQRHPSPEASSERNSAMAGPPVGLTWRVPHHVNKREPSACEI